jgi:ABC-type transport system involved in multi-copper enzyme maturation permease subunit
MEKAVKAVALSALGVTILFVILALTAVLGFESLGPDTAIMLGWWGAIPLVGLAILLAIAMLVMSIFTGESES